MCAFTKKNLESFDEIQRKKLITYKVQVNKKYPSPLSHSVNQEHKVSLFQMSEIFQNCNKKIKEFLPQNINSGQTKEIWALNYSN